MHKLSVAALAVSFVLVLTGASECETGKTPSDEPQPREDSGSCDITTRSYNSKGQEFIGLDCNLDGTQDSAAIVPSATAWPKCIKGTYYPACKNA